MTQVVSTYDGENITHRILWTCCHKQLEVARATTKGRMYFDLTVMLMAYCTYEAYLNFLGTRVAPAEWKNERDFFKKDPYKGTSGKLNKIIEVCGLCAVSLKGGSTYQTITSLEKLRNYIAHGKPDFIAYSIEHDVEEDPSMFPSDALGKMISEEAAERAVRDVEAFVECLHARARHMVTDRWYGEHALKGILGYSSTTTKPKA